MPDFTIPASVLSACIGAALIWATKRLVDVAEEAFRNWLVKNAETRKLIDQHIIECMIHRQSEAALASQVGALTQQVGEVRNDIRNLVDHLMK